MRSHGATAFRVPKKSHGRPGFVILPRVSVSDASSGLDSLLHPTGCYFYVFVTAAIAFVSQIEII